MIQLGRKAFLLLLLAAVPQGCSSDSGSGPDPSFDDNVQIRVTGAGDGEGAVTFTDTRSWTCRISVGSIPPASAEACSHGFYDAGGGGEIRFSAAPDPGHVFGGWSGDCSGTDPVCTVTFDAGDNVLVRVQATFLRQPASVTVTLDADQLEVGQTTMATATVEGSGPFQDLRFSWESSNPAVVEVQAGSPTSTAVVTGMGPGQATVTATVRQVSGSSAPITVAEPAPEPGTLNGTFVDADGVGVEGLTVRIGGPTPATLTTDADGAFEATDLESGTYTIFIQGVEGSRFFSSSVRSTIVLGGETTTEAFTAQQGSYLEVLEAPGDLEGLEGQTVSASIRFRVWNRQDLPLGEPALTLGVEGTPLAVFQFDSPGTADGAEHSTTLEITIPATGGTLYALLNVGVSVGTDPQPALDQYTDHWDLGIFTETFVPVGELTVTELQPGTGILQGTILDTDGATGIEGLVVRWGGPTAGNALTDGQGGYSALVEAGAYTMFAQGVNGLRYLATTTYNPVVNGGEVTVQDGAVTDGYHLSITGGEGDRTAGAGETLTITLDYTAWNRMGCPLCAPSITLGVDGTALAVYKLGSPGEFPGKSEAGVEFSVTVPSQGGTLYVMLTAVSTATSIQPALDLYEDTYANEGLRQEFFIPIGTLTVN
jgi:uncharacterized repeat protein (TIGR02543 family)